MPDVVLDWYATAGTGVITYTLELALDMNFTSPVVFTTEASSAKMQYLEFGTTYYWRVKATDGSGGESSWSAAYSFSTINRIDISKPDDGKIDSPANENIKWKTNYTGTLLSGVTYIDCLIDTSYYWQNTKQMVSDENFLGIASINGKSWAVGEGGTILYYNDTIWAEQTSSTNDDLNGVAFVDANNGWAVGEGGTILYYNGTEWAEQTSNTSDDLFGVAFVDATNGWAVGAGGTVLFFNGTEWAEQSNPSTKDLSGVSFLDVNNGWAIGKTGTIVFYNGTEWVEQTSTTTKDLYAISFLDANNGWATGKDGTIVYFNGTVWATQESGTSLDLNFVTAISSTEVWAGGEDGRMAQFDGAEWLEVTGGTIELLTACSTFGDDFGFAVGENGTIVAKNSGAFSSPVAKLKSTRADSLKFILSELYFGQDYFFKLRGRHAHDTSAWSSVQYFTTIAQPVNVAPVSGALNRNLDLVIEWEEMPGTYEYIYELCSDPEFSYSCTGYSETNSFTPVGLSFGETYYWHIKARHATDTTDWSDTWSFTVIDKMTHLSPANGSNVSDVFPTLKWQPVTGVNGFYVAYADNDGFDNAKITKIEDPEVSSFIVPEILDDGSTYYWNVRAFIAGDTTQWSDPWSFIMGGVGVNETLNSNNISIFPNPSKGLLFVEFNTPKQTPMQIMVSNLLGEVIIEEEFTAQPGINKRIINLQHLGTGVYLIKMQSGTEVYNQRVIIDR
jgi:hypothetical protein